MNEMRRWSQVFPCVLLLLAVGCGDDDDDDIIALEALPGEIADVYCDAFLPCLGPLQDVVLNGAECQSLFSAQFQDQELPRWQAAIEAGTLVYHPELARDCLDAFEAAGCDIASSRESAACEAALEGQVALGAACNATIECAGIASCVFEDQCPGTCSALVGVGEVCDEDDECDNGLACQDGTCEAPAGDGDACQGPDAPDCALGLVCVGQDDETAGSCQSVDELFMAGDGEPCDPFGSPLCIEGLSCVLDSIVDLEPVFLCAGPVGSGASCKSGVPDQCPADQACNADPFSEVIDGVCVSLPDDGEPCVDAFLGAGCAPGLTCIADVCTLIGRIGDPCTEDQGCYSDTCDGDTCTAPSDCAFEG